MKPIRIVIHKGLLDIGQNVLGARNQYLGMITGIWNNENRLNLGYCAYGILRMENPGH